MLPPSLFLAGIHSLSHTFFDALGCPYFSAGLALGATWLYGLRRDISRGHRHAGMAQSRLAVAPAYAWLWGLVLLISHE